MYARGLRAMERQAARRNALWLLLSCVLVSSVYAQRGAAPPPAGGRGAGPGGASVHGAVLSGTGQPMANLTVRALTRRVTPASPSPVYTVAATARTTPRGEYQFQALEPGDYVVDVPLTQVTLPPAISAGRAGSGPQERERILARLNDSFGPMPYQSGAAVGPFLFQTQSSFGAAPLPRPPLTDSVAVYPATFFAAPASRASIAEARVISLGAGDTYRADIRLQAVDARRVSGVLTGDPADIAHLGVRLLPVLDDQDLFREGDFEQAVTATDATGGFTFLGVPPGRYTLKVLYMPSVLPAPDGRGTGTPARVGVRGGGAPTAGALEKLRWAEAVVEVGSRDVTGLSLELHPAARVSGKLEFTDPAMTPAGFSGVTIGLFSNRPVTIAPPLAVPVSADGTFTALLYGPGKYRAVVGGAPGAGPAGFIAGGSAATDWLTVPASGVVDNLRVVIAAAPARGVGPSLPTTPPPPPSAENGFIAGRVIDGTSGIAVAGATVVVSQTVAAGNTRRVATSDADGAFTIGEAVAGSYGVTVTAPGYSPSGFGQLREDGATRNLGLAPRERVNNMVIRMWKPGRVSGRVTDDRGNPVNRLALLALSVTDAGAGREFLVRVAVRTDTAGTYQVTNLPPGRYVFCASFTPTTMSDEVHQALRKENPTGRMGGPFWRRLMESGAPAPNTASQLIDSWRFFMGGPDSIPLPMPAAVAADGTVTTYLHACSPGSAQLTEAKPLQVRAGSDIVNIDLRLTAERARRVSGSVRGPAGPLPNLGLRLLHTDHKDATVLPAERLQAAAAISDARGNFTFLGVPPGRYVLRAWTGPLDGPPLPAGRIPRPNGLELWAEIPITLADADLSNVAVTLAPTARVSGKLIFAGDGPPPDPSQFSIALQARQSVDPPLPFGVNPAADGTFVLPRYVPGRYNLPTVTVNGWRTVSATLNGKPLPDYALDVGAADLHNLVLTATNRSTTLSGRVLSEPGLAPIGATILIFPADHAEWIAQGMKATHMRQFRATGTWTYTAGWLPPGEYLAMVYREADGEDLTPAFITRIAPLGTKVTLIEGERVVVDLPIVSIR